MRRFTTPTLSLKVKSADLTGCRVFVTLTQGLTRIREEAEPSYDGRDTSLTVPLSQQQTGRLRAGAKCSVQVNWIDRSGYRNATTIKEVPVDENLLDVVVTYAD